MLLLFFGLFIYSFLLLTSCVLMFMDGTFGLLELFGGGIGMGMRGIRKGFSVVFSRCNRVLGEGFVFLFRFFSVHKALFHEFVSHQY